jgi:hypothetical protein
MAYIKLDANGVVIYKTPYNEAGTIEVADTVVCGMTKVGDTYISPPPPVPTYAEQRATAYPSIADQLDTIYHQGLDAWKATILAVKEEFPK